MSILLSSLFGIAPLAGAQTEPFVTEQVPVGLSPQAIAVNPVTNKTYVANTGSNTLTIIDGATGNPTFLGVGASPSAIAINTVTNKIYVADSGGVEVDVIDGATNSITPVLVGYHPESIAVNPVTNKIYVPNAEGDNLTVIDGATNATSTIATGTTPRAVAINPVTNKIYVANWSSNNVTVIDGVSGSTSTIAAGTNPRAIAVNDVTDQIYVANYGSNTLTDIDGASGTTTSIATGSGPVAVAIDEVSNFAYVLNYADVVEVTIHPGGTVTVVDGLTNEALTFPVEGLNPAAIAVDTAKSKVYVASQSNPYLSELSISRPLDSIHPVSDVPLPANGFVTLALAFNPSTGKLYAANESTNTFGTNNVAVLETGLTTTLGLDIPDIPTAAAINPITNKIYVANYDPNAGLYPGNVSVIDGATRTVTSLSFGLTQSVAVNPVTNKIYASNPNGDQVTEIDGATNATSAFGVGLQPTYIDINPVTNRLYITNQGDGNSLRLTVVDGSSNAILATLPGLSGPVAINPVTNKIYAWGQGSSTGGNSEFTGEIAEIDGATNAVSVIPNTAGITSGQNGFLIVLAVNPASNRLYVAYNTPNSGFFTVDLATKTVTNSIGLGTRSPQGLAVNPITNKIYLTTFDDTPGVMQCNLEIYDGVTSIRTDAPTIQCTGVPSQPVIDSGTNKIYFEAEELASANQNNAVTEYTVDGATNAVTSVFAGYSYIPAVIGGQQSVHYLTSNFTVLNPITHQVYHVGAYTPFGAAVFGYEQPVVSLPNPLTATITPLTGNATSSTSPTFNFTASSTYAPVAPPVQELYYQLDTEQGPWIPATGTAPNFTAALSNVPPGSHILYYYATDGSDSTDLAISTTNIGAVSAYPFTIVSQ